MIREKLIKIIQFKNKVITILLGITSIIIGLTSFGLMVSHINSIETIPILNSHRVIMIAASILFISIVIGFGMIHSIIGGDTNEIKTIAYPIDYIRYYDASNTITIAYSIVYRFNIKNKEYIAYSPILKYTRDTIILKDKAVEIYVNKRDYNKYILNYGSILKDDMIYSVN